MSVVSQYMTNLGKAHRQVVKWNLTHVRGPTNMDLVFDREYEVLDHANGACDLDMLMKYKHLACDLAIYCSLVSYPMFSLHAMEM